MRTSSSMLAVTLVGLAACSSGGGDSVGTDVAPVSATLIADAPPGFEWDVSPDGAWISYRPSAGEVCLVPVGVEEPETCSDLGDRRVGSLRWSPDSRTVVAVPDTYRTFQPGPLVVLDVADGTSTEIVQPPDPSDVVGAPIDAAFVDADTLVYFAVGAGDGRPAQFWSIDVDGSNQELVAEFGAERDEPGPLPDPGLLPLGDGVVLMPLRIADPPAGLSEFDFAEGTVREVVPGGVDARPSGPVAVQAVDGVVLVADVNRLADFGGQWQDGSFWSLLVDEVVIAVPDRGFHRTQSVALSPDGGQLAIFERYFGEDADGAADPNRSRSDVEGTLDATRISITSVESLVAGEPEWSDLSGFSEQGVVGDLDGQATGLVWTQPDRLWLELASGLFEVEVGSPG